jgi:methylated-DNA-[protein]-cysteine S-methyltransferase
MPATARRTSPRRTVVEAAPQIWVFSTKLGFMALVQQTSEKRKTGKPKFIVQQLSVAHTSPHEALQAIDPIWRFHAQVQDEPNSLVKRLQAYAAGAKVDFDDVEVAIDRVSAFRRRVLAACRAIPHGETRTYGEIALAAGAPRAARAVGTTMASVRVSIIIPCHRVVSAGGKLGGYCSPTLKRRLLELEKTRVSRPTRR